MPQENLQDNNVGNLGDILKHTALVQMAKLFADKISGDKYYLDSHSYLYQSRLASKEWDDRTRELVKKSLLYQDYIDLELPYINEGGYLCSSGLVHKVMPEAHLLLCEKNRKTREWLLQQLADNRVTYYAVKEQMLKWISGRSFKKLPNLLALIDPFELTDDLWLTATQCLQKMVGESAPVIVLVFDYKKESTRTWPDTNKNWLQQAASIARQPYHLAVYASQPLLLPVQARMGKLGWTIHDAALN